MSDIERPVGLAIVGAGLMGTQHARSAAACPDVELLGTFAADESQSAVLAEAHGVRSYPTWDDVLADDRVEAVLVATPTSSHEELALAALSAGRHAFVEKPVARTLESALRLRAAARAADRVLGVGHVIRYFPEYRAIADAIERGDVGTPAVATFGRRCQQPDWAPDRWHTDMARSGGVAVDMLVHDVDLVRWYFGEPTEVYARVVGSDRHEGLDYALATLTVPDGPICHLHGSWAEPEGFSQSAEVCGTGGMLSYDSRGRDELSFQAHAGGRGAATALPPPPVGPHDPFGRQLSDLARSIRTGAPLAGDIDWAIGSLRVALAMLESSQRREPVRLDPIEALLSGDDATVVAGGGRA